MAKFLVCVSVDIWICIQILNFIGSTQIPVIYNIRFQRVQFYSKVTFLPHDLYFRTKCEKSLNLLKVLSNTPWEADSTSLLRIYRVVIRTNIGYACRVYGSAYYYVLKNLTIHHSAPCLLWCIS